MRSIRGLNTVEPLTLLQQVFDEFLEANYSAAETDDVQRLEAALQVTRWLEPYAVRGPSPLAIDRRLSIRRLLHPMERLTQGFEGRTTELAQLRSFVGVLDPENRLEAVARFLRSFRATQSPLMLNGIGGIGKSTLLAEFIRQHVYSPVPFPWVYLDFDNPRLNVAVLSTLVEEAVEQLRAQYAGSEWTDLLTHSYEASRIADAASYPSQMENRTLALHDVKLSEELRERNAREVARLFADRVRAAMESSGLERMMHISEMLPLLIVIDTFEEVQKRGVEMARVLWQFLRALQEEFPRVRIVVSGRAPVPELGTYLASPIVLQLNEFDEGSAISFLVARGVSNLDVARALYRQVGGNPLNLKLAAQVAKLDGSGKLGIEGLKTSSYLIFAAAEHVVQGQLYRRILERIPDEDLQKLAHPGLVVRRITEDVIRRVLAEPCGLGDIDEERAKKLFAALKRQVDLVILEPDGAVRHQQDIRRVMLKMLEAERPVQVRQIHARAYEFYRSSPGTVAQIESVYHGLQLGIDQREIEKLWIEEATESMLSCVDELPAVSQLIVYSLSKHEPPQELRSFASQEQWERFAEERARQALQYADYEQVLKLLKEREIRMPGSALYAIEALAYMAQGNHLAARLRLDEGIRSAQLANRIDRLVELWRLRGEVLAHEKDFANADLAMAEAQELAMRMGVAVLALQIFAGRVRLRREGLGGGPPISELNEILRSTGDTDFGSVRLQLQGLFEACGPYSIPLLLKGLRVFKLQEVPYVRDWPASLAEVMKRVPPNRLNEYFQGLLLDKHLEQPNVVVSVLANLLEAALNPNLSKRAR
jgi:hypothetical protein